MRFKLFAAVIAAVFLGSMGAAVRGAEQGHFGDRDDLRAIYEYLLSIPAINVNVCGAPSE